MFFTTFWQELKKGKNQPRLQPQRNKKLFHYRIAHQKTNTKRTLHPMTRKVIIFAALAACLVGIAHADWVCSDTCVDTSSGFAKIVSFFHLSFCGTTIFGDASPFVFSPSPTGWLLDALRAHTRASLFSDAAS